MSIILYQIPFLTETNKLFLFILAFLGILTWILGIKNLPKENLIKKVVLYGFIVLWYTLIVIVSIPKRGLAFGTALFGMLASIIPLFIMSKVFYIQSIYDAIEKNIYLIITSIMTFIIGGLVTYGIANIMYQISDKNLVIPYFILSITLIVVQLFKAFNIKVEQKGFTIALLILSCLIIILVNMYPIIQMKRLIPMQEEVCNLVNSNTLTYKNIASQINAIIPEEYNKQIYSEGFEDPIFIFQYYRDENHQFMSTIKHYANNTNRINFKKNISEIQSFSEITLGLIETEKEVCNLIILSMCLSIIGIIGAYLFFSHNNK